MKPPPGTKFGKMITLPPQEENAFKIYEGFWKFGYDKLDFREIYSNIMADPRPRWCAETFPGFQKMKIVELGPADGYNTAALEYRGATDVTAIEGNQDAFLRCLILKNYLGLKAQYIIGDFTKFFEIESTRCDLCYASGILYHLQDPLRFLFNVSKKVKHIYLWTHFYDAKLVPTIENEQNCFANSHVETVTAGGFTAKYHRQIYNRAHMASAGYIGGLHEWANWMSSDDLFGALREYGFTIKMKVEDPPHLCANAGCQYSGVSRCIVTYGCLPN
jgi:Methyltransferase domain